MKNLLKKLLFTLSCFLIASSCFAIVTNLNSGATHSAINDAVTAATSGDTLLVSTGRYTYMNVNSKNLTISGGYLADFSDHVSYKATILDGGGYSASFGVSTSVVEGLIFTGANYGMQLNSDSVVTARYCLVENNTNNSYGAGVRILSRSTLVLVSTDIENNSAINTTGNGKGGGAYVSQGNLIVSGGSQIQNNYAAEKGGGVYIASSGYVEVKNNLSRISNNTADEAGGGVYLNNGELLVHKGGDIGFWLNAPNSTLGNGGGIYAGNSTVTFKDEFSDLINNHAGNDGGGAYLSNSTMTVYNYSDIGGGNGSQTNYAGDDGGGIYALDSTLFITNANILGCSAGDNGGAICIENSEVILHDCNVGSDDDIYKNFSTDDGGAIDSSKGNIFISKSTFFNNEAGGDGGVIRIYDCTLTITNSVFRNNIANAVAGVLYMYSAKGVVDICDSSIITNIAGSKGGGIYVSRGSNLTVRGNSEISANEAGSDGGAIFLNSGKLNILNSELNDNKADSDNDGNGNGGMLFLQSSSEVVLINESSLQVQRNYGINGGAICASENAKVSIITPDSTGTSINFNNATNGGAIYLEDNAVLQSYGKTRMRQNAAACGAAVFLTNGAIAEFLTTNGFNSEINGNTAEIYGGAFFATGTGTTLLLKNAIIGGSPMAPNRAEKSGGAVALFGSAQLTAVNCLFRNNIAVKGGGAIYASGGSIADVFGEFTAPSVSPPCVFTNNIAEYGGVFYATEIGSKISISDALLAKNTANANGGVGIVKESAVVDIENTVIAQNISPVCGGISVAFAGSTLLNYCTIAMNQSNGIEAVMGGAVVVSNSIVWGNIGTEITAGESVNYCNVEGGYLGDGNINLNPDFNDPDALDFSLLGISPCIDTGVFNGVNYDCLHEERPYGDGYDIGAYEFIPEPTLFLILNFGFWIYYYRHSNEKI